MTKSISTEKAAEPSSKQSDDGNPDSQSSPIEKYYQALVNILENDLTVTKWANGLSIGLVIILAIVFWKVFSSADDFLTNYLADVKTGAKVPSDKVVITILSIFAAKMAGIVGLIAYFFQRKHPHQPFPNSDGKS